MPYLAAYAIGLAYVITGDSVAARDPRRFWWALLGYPFVGLWGAANLLLNKLLGGSS
jgi:hypothetical protein